MTSQAPFPKSDGFLKQRWLWLGSLSIANSTPQPAHQWIPSALTASPRAVLIRTPLHMPSTQLRRCPSGSKRHPGPDQTSRRSGRRHGIRGTPHTHPTDTRGAWDLGFQVGSWVSISLFISAQWMIMDRKNADVSKIVTLRILGLMDECGATSI